MQAPTQFVASALFDAYHGMWRWSWAWVGHTMFNPELALLMHGSMREHIHDAKRGAEWFREDQTVYSEGARDV